MNTTPAPVPNILPDYIAILDDDARTKFFAEHPEFMVLGHSGAVWWRSELLRMAGDMDGAVAVLDADRRAHWADDAERRRILSRPSVTGRIMAGMVAASGPFLFGSAAASVAYAIHQPGLAALASAVATGGALFAGLLGVLTARRGS